MIMTLAWIYSVTLLVNAVVYEKESRLKEMMKIMGLADWEHWLAWFITSGCVMLVATILMTIIIKAGGIIVNSHPIILFFFILSFSALSVRPSSSRFFFSNSSVASAFAGVLFFLGYIPYTVVDRFIESMGAGALAASCLIPQIGFGLGCKYIGLWELANIGIQPDNVAKSPLMDSSFTFGGVLFMLWVDAFLLMLLTWYIEKVFPGKYGVPKPFYFPFTKSYWCSSCSKVELAPDQGDVEMTGDRQHFEEEPRNLKVGAALRALTKVYKPGLCACKNAKDFIAVNSVTYNFYEGQVTSFLGHNGAGKNHISCIFLFKPHFSLIFETNHFSLGKSTTVSILTGLYTPTTGTAYIYGHDIRTQMDQIRKHLGFCPQHNVLFNHLTVEDHIYFYGMLKGLDKSTIGSQIDSFVVDVGLDNKRFELSRNLSGGMKRKLSVAMAFVGDSKLIILDEPTAGVDPHARRSIWDVLGKFRSGRTILLTTHHMDEADILGDRICIIDKGRLVCSGSPMFLKKAFGHGYTLTLVTSCEQSKLLSFVQRYVPTSQLGECTTSEVTVKLPFNASESFSNLFQQLENSRDELGIESFGIEDCSLEEIFLNVTEADREETVDKDASAVVNLRSSRSSFRKERQLEAAAASNPLVDDDDLLDTKQQNSPRCATPSAVPLDMPRGSRRASLSQPPTLRYTDHPLRHQVKALWIKRFTVIRRSKMGFVAEFILPIFFILLSLGLQQIRPTDGDNPPMQLAPWYMLGTRDRNALRTKKLYSFVETLTPSVGNLQDAAKLKSHFYNTDSLGTRCVSTSTEHGNDKFSCLAPTNPPATWGSTPTNLPLDTSNCRCSYEKYPESAKCVDWPTPASKNLLSADIFENYTLYNVTNYIQSSVSKYFKIRFGGFSLFVNDTDPTLNYVSKSEVTAMGINVGNSIVYNFTASFSDALNALKPTTNNSELLRAQVWYDNRGYVSGPAYLNILSNAMLRSRLPTGASENLYGVSGWTHPITLRSEYVENTLTSQTITSAITVVSIIFALSFIPASFVLFLITERRTNAKHLQFVSGINPALYWLINHLWNMVNYLVPLVILILIFVAFKSEAFVSKDTIGPFIVIMLLFGFANAPVMYPFSWVLSVPSKAFTMLSCFNLGVGFVTTMSVAIVEMIALENKDDQMQNTANALKYVFLVFPHFCLGQGLMELNYYYQFSVKLKELADSLGVSVQTLASSYGDVTISDNAWEQTIRYIICLAVQSIVYFVLVLLIEYNFFCGQGCCTGRIYRSCHQDKYSKLLERREVEEDDVKAERDRVLGNAGGDSGGATGSNCLVIRDLVKIFHTRTGPRAAVNGVALGVSQRECFGFLGVNGAGKTTTFKMLTGDIDPTSGDATLNGHSILTDVLEAHKQMGYCPQFDALLPLLSGRETLQLFARIRGIAEDQIPELITYISRMVGIVPHLDKLTEEYSGGNKRKLSCGIAFIGGPPIVFLDEPTAGMDPGARRFLWRCIQRMVAAGSCVILTSHSMEDCQALCHRLTIMHFTLGSIERVSERVENHGSFPQTFVTLIRHLHPTFKVNGQLKCLGSPQHLKTKYGQGFTVFLRLPRAEAPLSETAVSDNGHQNPKMMDRSPAASSSDRLLTGDVLSLHERFMSELPEAQLKEEHGTLLQYQISQDVTLSRIFNVVNSLKSEGTVQDYSVNQTTLDQVFINFAKKQTEMTKEEKQGSKVVRSL
uniref:ABC transporter domain-containing protein n=1 Tax=Macrostomum lignano TaxID=282301 RepID=A0A1I8IFT6_9PLAT